MGKKRRFMRRFSFLYGSISISETRHSAQAEMPEVLTVLVLAAPAVPVKMTRQEHHPTQRKQQHAGTQQ